MGIKIKKENSASFWISAVGLLVVAASYIWWVSSDKQVNKAGYVAATVAVILFVGICLRFVPVWMKFWENGTELSPLPDRFSAGRLFVLFLLVDASVLALTCLFRYTMGDANSVWDGILFWNHLDAGNYLSIAEEWYLAPGENGDHRIVFFPFYPLTIRLVNLIVGNSMISALIISSLCHAGSACVLYKTLLLDYSQDCAARAVKYLAILPAAFFFSAPMNESIFFLLSVSCFYCARRGKWILASVLGGLAAFTRSMGVLIFAAVFIEAVAVCRKEHWNKKQLLCNFVSMLIIPMGIVAYLFINWQVTGDPFKFMEYQNKVWQQGFGLFFDMVAFQIDNGLAMVDTPDYATALGVWLPNVAYSFSVLLLMFFAAKKLRPSYTAWFIAYFAVAMGAKFLISGPRYLVALVPIYPALAEMSKNKKMDTALSIACIPFALFYLWACTMLWGVY